MHTVFVDGVLHYASGDQVEALASLKTFKSKYPTKDVVYRTFDDYSQLEEFMKRSQAQTVSVDEIDPFEEIEKAIAEFSESVVNQFDKWGINQDLANKVQKNSEEIIAQVQQAGAEGLKIIGDGFTTLGNIFKSAFESGAEPKPTEPEQTRTPNTTKEILDAIRRSKDKK